MVSAMGTVDASKSGKRVVGMGRTRRTHAEQVDAGTPRKVLRAVGEVLR